MYKKRYFVLVVMFWVTLAIDAQTSFKILSKDTYDSGALYGYMNGGSELYLEYGFQSLTVKELAIGEEKLTYQIYTMTDEKMAYGIFSVNVFKCGQCSKEVQFKCCNAYQLQAVIGNKYLSIINATGSSDVQEAAQLLYEEERNKSTLKSFVLPEVIKQLNPTSIFAVNGALAIENRVAYWSDAYDLIKPGFSYIIKWKDSDVSAMLFQEGQDLAEESFQDDDYLYRLEKKDGLNIIFRYSKEKGEEVDRLLRLL